MAATILLGSFVLFMMIGVPVAYAMGLASLLGALWIDLPLDAVMIQLASGVNKFSLLAVPFFSARFFGALGALGSALLALGSAGALLARAGGSLSLALSGRRRRVFFSAGVSSSWSASRAASPW